MINFLLTFNKLTTMKVRKLILTLVLLSIGYVSYTQVTTWKATQMYATINEIEVFTHALDPFVLVSIDRDEGKIILNEIDWIKYDYYTEVTVRKDDVSVALYTAIDFEAENITLSISFTKDNDNVLFLLLGTHYTNYNIYYKLYPTQESVKALKRRIVV